MTEMLEINPAPDDCGLVKQELETATVELELAKHELEHAEHDLIEAEKHLYHAERELHHTHEHHHHECQDLVPIEVNGPIKYVRPGKWIVAELKAAIDVPANKVLAIVRPDSFDNLDDTACIEVHAYEKFVSHARRGGSS